MKVIEARRYCSGCGLIPAEVHAPSRCRCGGKFILGVLVDDILDAVIAGLQKHSIRVSDVEDQASFAVVLTAEKE